MHRWVGERSLGAVEAPGSWPAASLLGGKPGGDRRLPGPQGAAVRRTRQGHPAAAAVARAAGERKRVQRQADRRRQLRRAGLGLRLRASAAGGRHLSLRRTPLPRRERRSQPSLARPAPHQRSAGQDRVSRTTIRVPETGTAADSPQRESAAVMRGAAKKQVSRRPARPSPRGTSSTGSSGPARATSPRRNAGPAGCSPPT